MNHIQCLYNIIIAYEDLEKSLTSTALIKLISIAQVKVISIFAVKVLR